MIKMLGLVPSIFYILCITFFGGFMKKLAIYGGSFDPVTVAHKDIMLKLSKLFDFVIITPAYQAMLKDSHTFAFADRVNMLNMLQLPPNVSISNLEKTNYDKFQGKSYEIIKYYSEKYKDTEIHFILGADQLKKFDKWFNWKLIIDICKINVVTRDNNPIAEYPWIIGKDLPITRDFDTMVDCSSTELRKAIIRKDTQIIEKLAPPEIISFLAKGSK